MPSRRHRAFWKTRGYQQLDPFLGLGLPGNGCLELFLKILQDLGHELIVIVWQAPFRCEGVGFLGFGLTCCV